MAVLKYRASDGTIKTLEIRQSVSNGGVVSVNGKTGVVTGLYDSDNPPPYPVRSVNGKTGAVSGLYDEENQPPYPVTSVNGKTGAVSGLYDEENQPPYPVTSVNGKTGAVSGIYDEENQPPYPVTSVNGKTGAVTGLYDAENPPKYPVTSVNGREGDVTGLYDAENPPPYPVSSVNGKTGTVTGIYDDNNPPPYPVTSVDGKTGSITSVISISAPASVENQEYIITVPPRTCCILLNALNPFTTDETTLPAGSEDGITLVGDGFYPGELLAGYFNRGYIMCKETYLDATSSAITYKNFGSSASHLKYNFNILLVNGRPVDSRLTIRGYY